MDMPGPRHPALPYIATSGLTPTRLIGSKNKDRWDLRHAATATARDLVIITRNTKDFEGRGCASSIPSAICQFVLSREQRRAGRVGAEPLNGMQSSNRLWLPLI